MPEKSSIFNLSLWRIFTSTFAQSLCPFFPISLSFVKTNVNSLALAQQVAGRGGGRGTITPASPFLPRQPCKCSGWLASCHCDPSHFWSPAVWEAIYTPARIASNPKCTQLCSGGVFFKQAPCNRQLRWTSLPHHLLPLGLAIPCSSHNWHRKQLPLAHSTGSFTSLAEPHQEIYNALLVIAPYHQCLLGVQRADS